MADLQGSNQFSTLNGHFKETYADRIQDLRPEGVKLLKNIPFMKSEKMPGNFYHAPVTLSYEHGFTYGGSSGSAFALEQAINSIHGDAQVRGSEIVLRSYLSVGAASRAVNSKASFISETKFIVENMYKSFVKRLEIGLLYGQMGIGEVESITGTVLKIEDHEWASGIWSGSENMPITILSNDGTTLRGHTTVASVNIDTKEVTLSSAPAGVVATDIIYFKTAAVAGPTFNEFAGIHKIITNTGTLFNISAATYNLWKGNLQDVGTNFAGGEASLSFAKIEEGISKAMAKGLSDEEIMLLCSPKAFSDLIVEQSAKRQYDSSYSNMKFENGGRSITFFAASGKIVVEASIYCKEGYAYGLPLSSYVRIGSSDVTFDQPGLEGKFVMLKEDYNAYEFRAMCDQSVFSPAPGLSILFRYIA